MWACGQALSESCLIFHTNTRRIREKKGKRRWQVDMGDWDGHIQCEGLKAKVEIQLQNTFCLTKIFFSHQISVLNILWSSVNCFTILRIQEGVGTKAIVIYCLWTFLWRWLLSVFPNCFFSVKRRQFGMETKCWFASLPRGYLEILADPQE